MEGSLCTFAAMNYAIVDIETTGGSTKNSKITEIAIYKHDGKQVIDSFETLINPEIPIPIFIARLTGIRDEMVENSPRFFEIAKKIIEFTEGCVFVAHNVLFDYGIIRHEFKLLGYDYRKPHLCTVRAARYVIPGFESYSLGKLTRAMGIEIIGRHRAGGDALATAELFTVLINKDPKGLQTFVQDEINPQILHPNLDLNFLEEIPNKPGLYKFFNETNQLIFIGKAKQIRKRIEQHLKHTKTIKGDKMRLEITRIEFELTGSELIALLMESELVKHLLPLYNPKSRKKTSSNELFPNDDFVEPQFPAENFYTIEPGRDKKEKALVCIENGTYRGFGFAPFYVLKTHPKSWSRMIDFRTETTETRAIILNYLQKNPSTTKKRY